MSGPTSSGKTLDPRFTEARDNADPDHRKVNPEQRREVITIPAPKNPHRYVGVVRRPDGSVTREIFLSLKDVRTEIRNRHRNGTGSRLSFDYAELGTTVDPRSVRQHEVTDRMEPGTTVELHQVHRDSRVEPLPKYRVVLNKRGGTTATRLKEGLTPR